MFEKVSKMHPDKIADRIAGAIVDYAYSLGENPRCAVEVLIGHKACNIIIETTVSMESEAIKEIVDRIAGQQDCYNIYIHPQDKHLSDNQGEGFRCGDNGIFVGYPINEEEKLLTRIAGVLGQSDGKYIIDTLVFSENDAMYHLIICQSNKSSKQVKSDIFETLMRERVHVCDINPLGSWTGGLSVDSGATNRKLGSDMGRAVTGGGLHGKDFTKADVTLNIMCHKLAQESGQIVKTKCAIGDEDILFENAYGSIIRRRSYQECVEEAKAWLIGNFGGFEGFAEYGLIAPHNRNIRITLK